MADRTFLHLLNHFQISKGIDVLALSRQTAIQMYILLVYIDNKKAFTMATLFHPSFLPWNERLPQDGPHWFRHRSRSRHQVSLGDVGRWPGQ
jgi:hypothetical protein